MGQTPFFITTGAEPLLRRVLGVMMRLNPHACVFGCLAIALKLRTEALISPRMQTVEDLGHSSRKIATGGLLATIALCWFVLSPLLVLALGALSESLGVLDDESTVSQLAVLYGLSMLLAFLVAGVGGLRARNARGERRWGTSLATCTALLVYLLIALFTVRVG